MFTILTSQPDIRIDGQFDSRGNGKKLFSVPVNNNASHTFFSKTSKRITQGNKKSHAYIFVTHCVSYEKKEECTDF